MNSAEKRFECNFLLQFVELSYRMSRIQQILNTKREIGYFLFLEPIDDISALKSIMSQIVHSRVFDSYANCKETIYQIQLYSLQIKN
jgi:hypothetical protein